MIGQLVGQLAHRLVGEISSGQTVPLLQQLDPRQRVRVMAALVVVVTCGGFLLIFVRASGHVARWYMNRRPQAYRMPPATAPLPDDQAVKYPEVGELPDVSPETPACDP